MKIPEPVSDLDRIKQEIQELLEMHYNSGVHQSIILRAANMAITHFIIDNGTTQ